LRPLLSPDFRTRVRALVAKGKEVAMAQRTSVLLFLQFCRDYEALHRNATADERTYLHRQTGIDEPSLRSAYRRIGEQYGALKRHARALPQSQESIKELARAESRRPGVLAKLVARDIIHRDVSVFTVRNHVRRVLPSRVSVDFPSGRYGVILADPPWSYENQHANFSPTNHYPTQSLAWIHSLPVSGLAAKHCALFMWVTSPLLVQGLETMTAWGFEYRTVAFVWSKLYPWGARKPVALPGNWTMSNIELCLLGVRGRPRRVTKNVLQLVTGERGRHSEKPDEVRQRIVRLMGNVPRIELFARSEAAGWETWGDERR
jgi:N6-adenosine-specific RNA methylase IME4